MNRRAGRVNEGNGKERERKEKVGLFSHAFELGVTNSPGPMLNNFLQRPWWTCQPMEIKLCIHRQCLCFLYYNAEFVSVPDYSMWLS